MTVKVLAVTVFVLLVLVLAVRSCFSNVGQTSWYLTQAPSGNELHLAVQLGGCDRLDGTSVSEIGAKVSIRALLHRDAVSSCDDILTSEAVTVELQVPLGDRTLEGCAPPYSKYRRPASLGDDCGSAIRPMADEQR